ncbi:hypothetical protein K2X33_05725, partial [bacterium]|nr:hypothetical protein [bacterium]
MSFLRLGVAAFCFALPAFALPLSEAVFHKAIQFPAPQWIPAEGGKVRVEMPGSKSFRVETLPVVPYFEVELPEAVTSLSFESLEFEPATNPAPLEFLPETFLWTKDPSVEFRSPDPGPIFPGFFARLTDDGRRAQLFPVQLEMATGQTRTVRSLVLVGSRRKQPFASAIGVPANTPTAVILAPKALEEGAHLLRSFHANRYGVQSQIVFLEDVLPTEAEIPEDQLPYGYKDRAASDAAVEAYDSQTGKGYPYAVARKLAHYFQKRIGPNGIRYLTVLGTGDLVPPSYYFGVRAGFGAKFVASDQCYAATDTCLTPQAVVGRLPLQTNEQVKAYLKKVDNWRIEAPKAARELTLFGGKAFGGPFYIGELGALRALGPQADWKGAAKYFRTSGNYTRDGVLDTLSGGGDAPLVYSLDHGFGNQWMVEQESISSRELAQATGGAMTPVVFSISCSNAAFDQAFAKDDVFPNPSAGDQSIGVTLMQSPAGTVAYLGSTRLAAGQPLFDVDAKGNLNLSDSSYGLKVLD